MLIFADMFSKEKIISLFVVVLMMTAAAITVNKSIFGHKIGESPVAQSSLPETVDATIDEAPDGEVIIHTAELPGLIDGYAGAVPLDIIIKDGRISEVKPLPNSETPSFFNRASAILSSWNGKTPEEALEMKVDAVSGATFSSDAIINNVNVGLANYVGTKDKNLHLLLRRYG